MSKRDGRYSKTFLIFLSDALTQTEKEKQVVIAHHVPTLLNYPAQYKNSPINEVFATDLISLLK